MEHPAFAEAGQEAGIEVWTIDKFEPVPIDKRMYGKFYNGDSYIVLKTTGEVSLTYDAHFWLGSNTTQDKKGSAAIWTVTLDDMLGGRAVHHREVQGHESSQFLGYFQPAIRYLDGGNDSGFNEVETNAGAEKRLLKLSGCENMRIEEVPADSSSLTRDHCFILEVEHDIFVLMPEGAKATQRRKIISVANSLRDDYHNGRATIEIIDDFSSDEDVAMFFEALGSGSMEELMEDDTSQTYSREDPTAVYLYRVLAGEELELVSLSKPYKQRHLSSAEVYILDTPCSGVYVWLGRELEADVKKNYNEIAQNYLDMKGYPSWVHVTRVTEGNESCTFKQYFHNWDTVASTSGRSLVSESDAGYFSGDAEESGAAAKKIGKSASARGYMPDSGDGSYTVLRMSSGDEEDVTDTMMEKPILYQCDVYVVKYQYSDENGEEAYVVYVWMGADSEAADRRAFVEMASQIDQDLEANVTLVKVPQGKEPKHFLSIFKGNLAVLYGTRDDECKPENYKKSYDEDGVRLFRVEGTEPGVDMRAVQVPESAEVLEDDDVFVLETPNSIYVWHGKESDEKEQQAAMSFLSKVLGDDKEVAVLEQGSEDDDFWEYLGGAPEEKEDASGWRMAVNRRVTAPRTLTAVTVNVTGKIRFEDLSPDFTQQDLSDDSVYILDTGEELYFWMGKNTPERVKMAKDNIIQEYIADDGLDRTVDSAIVVSVKRGKEPAVFKKLFPSWDEDMWDQQASYEDMKNEAKASNSK